ncbi:MAG: UDP-N-acetylmuramate--L-alanine ligase [Actinomycetota bacterium]
MTYDPPPGSIPTLGVPSLDGLQRIHLVGVGGAGMRGIAHLLLARGFEVSGSDLKESRGLEELRAQGARIFVGHAASQLGAEGDPDAVVVSSAIPQRNPELAEARERGLPVWARAQVLAALMAGSRTIAVAGTHGKTTTTSMLCVILERAGLDPTYVIGGDLNESGSGAKQGAGEWFVAETDESDGSFLLLAPEIGVVTNVEEDHLDFYRDGDEIRAAFASFVNRCGSVIACADDAGAREVLAAAPATASQTYGIGEDAIARLRVLDADRPVARAELVLDDGVAEIELRIPGTHNLLNAAGAILAARATGVDPRRAAEALRSFSGVRRRFEYRGVVRGAELFDDYAHHPTEVAATLEAADGHRRILAVFQPHRYSRTRALGRALGESLAGAHVVVVTDVYGAGEEPIPGITGKVVVDGLAESAPSKRVLYLPRRSDVVQYLLEEIRAGDLVLSLGAGDITTLADELIDRARSPIEGAKGRV